jgi:pimeloyl-ACP methyl ester carboxylesterase
LRQTIANMSAGSGAGATTSRSTGAAYLRRRTCPVLSFYTDPTRVPVEEALFDDARSRSLSWPGSGHWLHQERPSEFNAIVDEWLRSL